MARAKKPKKKITRADVTPDCEAYRNCRNLAESLTYHPVLGLVPICQRCAAKLGYDDLAEHKALFDSTIDVLMAMTPEERAALL